MMRDIIAPIQGNSVYHTGYQENANQITGDHLPYIRLMFLPSFIHSLRERVGGGIKREDKKKNWLNLPLCFCLIKKNNLVLDKFLRYSKC